MRTFKISKDLEIVCEWKKTRNAFKHEATLLRNGREVDKTKICYLNRTWERFEFDSVIKNLLSKTDYLSKNQKTRALKKISGENEKDLNNKFGTIARISALGDVFGKTDKEKNDWKLKMIKKGLGAGFVVPDDWDQLTEKEKGTRLDKVIEHLKVA